LDRGNRQHARSLPQGALDRFGFVHALRPASRQNDSVELADEDGA
jgi:hypothetical protein